MRNLEKELTSNRVAYKECFTFDNINTKVVQLSTPGLKCIKGVGAKVTRIWFVRITITNKINGINLVRSCKERKVFPPVVAVIHKI